VVWEWMRSCDRGLIACRENMGWTSVSNHGCCGHQHGFCRGKELDRTNIFYISHMLFRNILVSRCSGGCAIERRGVAFVVGFRWMVDDSHFFVGQPIIVNEHLISEDCYLICSWVSGARGKEG